MVFPYIASAYFRAKECMEHSIMPWAKETIPPLISQTYSRLFFWYIIAKAYITFQYGRVFPEKSFPPTWKFHKAFLMRDSTYDFKDITEWFDPASHESLTERVADNFPDWNDWRIELRCSFGERKYRIILREHDTFQWPPVVDETAIHHFHNMRAPQGILSAVLIAKKEIGATDMDVTKRVQKYAGPNNDFHGTTVYVKDLFPMDDHEDNAARFTGIRVIELHPKSGLSVKMYSYERNDNLHPKIKYQ